MPRHIRVIPIAVTTWPDEATRTSNSACIWTAEATVEGRTYTARSRHGPANQLARQLVAAGFPDRPMVIRYRGLVGTMTYRSFHAAATWTFSEGERRLRRVRYKEPPEGIFLGSGTGQKCVSSPLTDDAERPPANGRKAEAPLPAVETRQCEACDADFRRPARACRKAADPRPLSCLLTDPRSALGSSGLASQWQSTTKLYDRRGYNPEKAASFFATY